MPLPRRPKRNNRHVRRAHIRHKIRVQRTKQRVHEHLLRCWYLYSSQNGDSVTTKPTKTQLKMAKFELYQKSFEYQTKQLCNEMENCILLVPAAKIRSDLG